MNQKMQDYLASLSLTKAVENRVREVYEFYLVTCPEDIDTVFITDYITEEGLREYENLWFFSPRYWMEAKSFLSMDIFDFATIREVVRWEVRGENYDYKNATTRSRLHVTATLAMVTANLRASQENCDYLMSILRERITTNVVR